MSTKSLVDFCVPFAQQWGRSGTNSILALLQEGQDELFRTDAAVAQWFGADNEGFPPYLKTSAGVHEYDITAANLSASALTVGIGGTDYPVRARRVLKVFIDATNGGHGYGHRWLGKPYLWSGINAHSLARTRLMVADVPVQRIEALEGTTAKVRFREDPGATTDKYFCLFTYEPPRLLSTRIPLAVPAFWERALRDYVLGTIETMASGSQSEKLSKWETVWVPQFKGEFAIEGDPADFETSPRWC